MEALTKVLSRGLHVGQKRQRKAVRLPVGNAQFDTRVARYRLYHTEGGWVKGWGSGLGLTLNPGVEVKG